MNLINHVHRPIRWMHPMQQKAPNHTFQAELLQTLDSNNSWGLIQNKRVLSYRQ